MNGLDFREKSDGTKHFDIYQLWTIFIWIVCHHCNPCYHKVRMKLLFNIVYVNHTLSHKISKIVDKLVKRLSNLKRSEFHINSCISGVLQNEVVF